MNSNLTDLGFTPTAPGAQASAGAPSVGDLSDLGFNPNGATSTTTPAAASSGGGGLLGFLKGAANVVAGPAVSLGSHLGQLEAGGTANVEDWLGNKTGAAAIRAKLAQPLTTFIGSTVQPLKPGMGGAGQMAGDAAQNALYLVPGLGGTGAGFWSNLAKGALFGYAQGSASNLSNGESLGQAVTPQTSNVLGAATGGTLNAVGTKLAGSLTQTGAVNALQDNLTTELTRTAPTRTLIQKIGPTQTQRAINLLSTVPEALPTVEGNHYDVNDAIDALQNRIAALGNARAEALDAIDNKPRGYLALPAGPAKGEPGNPILLGSTDQSGVQSVAAARSGTGSAGVGVTPAGQFTKSYSTMPAEGQSIFPFKTGGSIGAAPAVTPYARGTSLDAIAAQAKQNALTIPADAEPAERAAIQQRVLTGQSQKMNNQIDSVIQDIKNTTGKTHLSATELEAFKEAQTKASKVFKYTGATGDANGASMLGNAAKEKIEKLAADAGFPGMQEYNQYMKDHYNAIALLQRLGKQTVQGGRLGTILASHTAALLGGAAAAATGGGFPGAVAASLSGEYGTQLLSKIMSDNSLTNPMRDVILSRISQEDPEIVQQLMKFSGGAASKIAPKLVPVKNALSGFLPQALTQGATRSVTGGSQ